jgi:hypothetical protein
MQNSGFEGAGSWIDFDNSLVEIQPALFHWKPRLIDTLLDAKEKAVPTNHPLRRILYPGPLCPNRN